MFLIMLAGNCLGLSHLGLIQGEKAQFSRLNEHFSTMKNIYGTYFHGFSLSRSDEVHGCTS